MRIVKLFIGALALVFTTATYAVEKIEVMSLEEGASSPAASIEDIAWLTGRWEGSGLGGLAEEVIAPAVDGQMMGMFRHAGSDGELVFYEFYLFAEVDDSLVLRIKHFSPELKGWEEKNDYEEFPLVSVTENAVYFDGLTYKLTSENELRAAVSVEGQGIVEFQFTRR